MGLERCESLLQNECVERPPAPSPRKPFATIDARTWALGVVDGFYGRRSRPGVVDGFSYGSGRIEGQAAREQALTADDVLIKYRSPYREAQFRPVPQRVLKPKPSP